MSSETLRKGNVISGNLNYGIAISGTGTSMNTVKGNFIGLNAAATGGIGKCFFGRDPFQRRKD